MEQEEVQVVRLEFLAGRIEGFLDTGIIKTTSSDILPKLVRPDLGGDEDLLAIDSGGLEGISDFLLVAIEDGCVDVSVSCLEGPLDGFFDFAALRRIGPKSDLGHGVVVGVRQEDCWLESDDPLHAGPYKFHASFL